MVERVAHDGSVPGLLADSGAFPQKKQSGLVQLDALLSRHLAELPHQLVVEATNGQLSQGSPRKNHV